MGKSRIYSHLTKTAPFQGYAGRIVDYPLRAADAASWAHAILPPAVVATVNWQLGEWSAPLPEHISDDAAHEFSRGMMPEPPTSAWVTPDLEHLGHEFVAHMAATLKCSVSDLVQVPKPSLVLVPAQWAVDHLTSSAHSLALVANIGGRRESGSVVWTSPMGEFYPLSGSLDRDALADLMDSAASATKRSRLIR